MFARAATRFVIASVSFFLTIVSAIDPISTSGSGRSVSENSDSFSGKITLVSLTRESLLSRPDSVVSNSSQLPEDVVASIREVYVWGWPLVYMSNLKQSMQMIRSPGRSGGAPVAPVNSLCMLTDVVSPDFQSVPCPNRDVVYGFGVMDLAEQPVVVQVPDFGNRFWLYQIGDHRMESIGTIGSMYGTRPGFIMVVGPDWQGSAPRAIQHVIRSTTNLAYILPRVVVHDRSNDVDSSKNLDKVLGNIAIYPLSRFNGQFKRKNWKQTRWYPALGRSTRERNKLVRPERFFDDLGRVLGEIEATPAEQPLVDLAKQLVHWNRAVESHQIHLQQLAAQFEEDTIQPMFDLSRSGIATASSQWVSIHNGAAFGDDYWTRTAIAKSNPFVNRQEEAKYYYLERSEEGQLRGNQSYSVHFRADQLPPTNGFWSLTLYNADHQFHPNAAGRYCVGNLNELHFNEDGSLTITVQAEEPAGSARPNWLPAPPDGQFKLYLRLYAPKPSALNGDWVPPLIHVHNEALPKSL
jgi:hypothetical protein